MRFGSSHAERVLAVAGDRSASARSALAASWARCVHRHRLDPDEARGPQQVGGAELARARERLGTLLPLAQPVLDHLFAAVGASGCCVLLTDRDGVPLERRGAAGDDDAFRSRGLWTGTVWSEAAEGTNGIGTCLAEERGLTVHRDEHFHARNTALSCTVAPVFGPDGALAAALDVSSCRAGLGAGEIGLIAAAVAEAARRLEMQGFRHAHAGARILLAPDRDGQAGGLLAVDRDELVVGATRAARLAHGLDARMLSRRLPLDTVLAGAGGQDGRAPVAAKTHGPLGQAEHGALRRALARSGGNVSEAARMLGISRATLHRKMARLGVRPAATR